MRKGAKAAAGKSAREKTECHEKAWTEFVAVLRERGDRVTHARRIVFRRVLKRRDHFRADELALELARGPNRVSRGTVYRTLALMEQTGFVHSIREAGSPRYYEHICGRDYHDHMVCEKCGAFYEFSDAALCEMLERNCRRRGFHRLSHRVVVFGICAECRKEEKARKISDRSTSARGSAGATSPR